MRYGSETADILRKELASLNVLLREYEKERNIDRDVLSRLRHTKQDMTIAIKVLEDYLQKPI